MDLIRDKRFKEYVMSVVSYCYQTQKGLSDVQARLIFKDTFFDDYNMLDWILDGTYPNTRREGDKYLFITDPMIHEDINGGRDKLMGNVGRMTLEIIKSEGNITFENKSFKAGPIDQKSGRITCYGEYRRFADNVCQIGFSGALMDLYNFARVSHHNTVWGDVKTYA